ncbi:acetate/propionate family kinase [Arthrobacter mobilis]|uniref:Acetate kinase n=1 Tax=Arthrobacter mobilis TaxID=2724944 RepID=A0A7X6HBD7_9MICC|nr:acetate kinase [Arthrobacter mobilis]NKX53983.1 acetate kinase [Arthrobacter mobilis]
MLVLVINSGSSSLKYSVRLMDADNPDGGGRRIAGGVVERIGEDEVADHTQAFGVASRELQDALGGQALDAVGHRVVHGGERFTGPVLIDNEITRSIERLNPLAPLHNPPSVLCLRAAVQQWPRVPQVAVFDTAFHRTLPEPAWRYALPDGLYRRYGIRRYGFHGTSVEYVGRRAAALLNVPWEKFDGVVAHLGNGASVTAIQGGRSVDTSMGFTPLEGLVMGTRSGDVDPGILIFLLREGYGADELDSMLNRNSGFKALAGHNDMRAITEAAAGGDEQAGLALEIAAHRLARYIGGYHVACGGARAVVLTGGIGENSAAFRARVLAKLAPLGISLDTAANEAAAGLDEGRTISGPGSAIPVLVVPTDEEAAVADATAAVVLQS